MDSDLFLSAGVVLGALAFLSFLSAWRAGRAPRVGAILLVVAGVLIVAATLRKPGGYTISDVPSVIVSTVSRLLR